MDRVQVSVLMPVRNAAETIECALHSLQRQSLTSWEAILVDDGSDDETPAILQEWTKHEPRLSLVSPGRCGLVSALNLGLAECRAPYVARMDADDGMHRDRLRLQYAHLERNPDLAAVGCRVRLFPTRGLQAGMQAYQDWLNRLQTPEDIARDRYVECPLAHPALMIRRDVLQRHGYRDQGWPEDYDLILRLLEDGSRLANLPQVLLAWRDHPGRHSRTAPAFGLDRFLACKLEFLLRGFLAPHEEYILCGYGSTGRALRAALHERGKRLGAVLEVHPGRIGNRIHGAPVHAYHELPRLAPRPILVSVAGAEARAAVRAELNRHGLLETRDFYCLA